MDSHAPTKAIEALTSVMKLLRSVLDLRQLKGPDHVDFKNDVLFQGSQSGFRTSGSAITCHHSADSSSLGVDLSNPASSAPPRRRVGAGCSEFTRQALQGHSGFDSPRTQGPLLAWMCG